ncbi:hypothetical protein DRQ07_06270 [candidate division KSB1 bacterium]|nr:MAG: hypothetical protein DRQ07_06270 [candidate division KSB1 bacterium]
MIRKLVVFVLIIIVIFVVSCISDRRVNVVKITKPIKSFDSIGNKIFFGKITSIINCGDTLYLNDASNNNVLQVFIEKDTTLRLIRTFGRTGAGPGEFRENWMIYINNGRLYVENINVIHVFLLQGKFLKIIRFPGSASFLEQFVVDNREHIYKTRTSESDYCIAHYDNNGNFVSEFGELIPWEYKERKLSSNHRHLVMSDNEEIISVSVERAQVDKFTRKGRIISTLKLENKFDILKNTLDIQKKVYEKDREKGVKYVSFINISYINKFGNQLYILFAGYDFKRFNKFSDIELHYYLLAVDISGESCKLTNIYSFPKHDFYSSAFCILKNDLLLTYNYDTGSIEIYKIPGLVE